MYSAWKESSFHVTGGGWRSLKAAMSSPKHSTNLTRCRGTIPARLTTAIHPRAGMLSLTAERWLNIVLPRFLSLKVWISWIFSDIGFRSAATSFWKQTLSPVTEDRTEAQHLHPGWPKQDYSALVICQGLSESSRHFSYGHTVFSFSEVWKWRRFLTLLMLSPETWKKSSSTIQSPFWRPLHGTHWNWV